MAKARQRHRGQPPGRFRVIGGRWRGRRFEFDPTADLRPTPDRVRETLFNWLQNTIEGATCLDLYAGSGALGLEALSRGAARCVFVDREPRALAAIQGHLAALDCTDGAVVQSDAGNYLAHTGERFDVVFLDPPFEARPWQPILGVIDERALLRPYGCIYLENLAIDGEPPLPDGWRLRRSKRAGRVGYHLAVMHEGSDT